MKLSDFDYKLPKELIANIHMEPRDHSRLLVLDRSLGYARDGQIRSGQIEHKKFYNILEYLRPGDVLVFNNSKVFKARIFGTKKTGGKIEFLLVRPIDDFVWESLVKGRVNVEDKIIFEKDLNAEIVSKKEKVCEVRFNKKSGEVFKYLEKYGTIPLPPYVKNVGAGLAPDQKGQPQGLPLREKNNFYQTVYADKVGSVAAPTAGFHFTKELLDKLKKKGVECLNLTLHVGPGTFLPVETENIENHKMHEEFFEVKKDVWNKILDAKKSAQGGSSRRIIAVGTTTCRVLESMIREYPISNIQYPIKSKITNSKFQTGKIFGSTDIFIYPPYDFKIVDCLITNFHLPKSTLLMLVSAFLDPKGKKGIRLVKKIYTEAVKERYWFYSFGDSMFIQ